MINNINKTRSIWYNNAIIWNTVVLDILLWGGFTNI